MGPERREKLNYEIHLGEYVRVGISSNGIQVGRLAKIDDDSGFIALNPFLNVTQYPDGTSYYGVANVPERPFTVPLNVVTGMSPTSKKELTDYVEKSNVIMDKKRVSLDKQSDEVS
jgi:hypothetical protein